MSDCSPEGAQPEPDLAYEEDDDDDESTHSSPPPALLTPDHLLRLFRIALSETDSNIKAGLTTFISRLLDKENNTFFRLDRSSMTFTIKPTTHLRGYTAQFWIRLNDDSDGTVLTIADKIQLRVESGKLAVYDRNTLIDRFDTFTLDKDVFYHITIEHELSSSGQRARAKLRLFINADYIQHVRCPYPFSTEPDFGSTVVPSLSNSITIGSTKTNIDFTSILFLSGCQSFEWIALSYFLGRYYNGGYQDDNLLRFLNYNQRTWFNIKLLEVTNNTEGNLDMNNLQVRVSKDRVLLLFNQDSVGSPDFQLSDNQVASPTAAATILGKVNFYSSQEVSEVFYSIAPLELILELIDSAKDITAVHNSVKLFFQVINSNWKFVREIESTNGYSTLATLLKFKKLEFKESYEVSMLETHLEFIGYNSDSPFNSIITNHIAYETLIMDFQLWKPNTASGALDTPVTELLLFQLTVFARECKYNAFNVIKLKKMKIVRRLLTYLAHGFFPKKTHASVESSLILLVKASLSPETIKTLSSFVIYSLNEGNDDNALLALRALSDVSLDPLFTNAGYWKKLFGSVSIKYLLLLMQLGKENKLVMHYALTLIIKTFVMVKKAYDLFIKNNGLHILFASIRETKVDLTDIGILIKGSFGHYVYDHNFEKLKEPYTVTTLDTVIIPELHYVIFDLLEWLVLNDIFQDASHAHVIALLDSYTNFVSQSMENNQGMVKTFGSDRTFLRKLCNLVILLSKPQNTTIYFESCEKIVELLSSMIVGKLLKGDHQSVEAHITGVLQEVDDNNSSNIHTIFLCLVFPKVLVHLKEFSPEFEVLLQTDSMNFTNIAIFLNLLQPELLVVEWNPSDYFNYLSVVMSLLESYKNAGRSLKNTHYLQLSKNVTPIMNTLVFVLKDSKSEEQQENFITMLMFHQESLFRNDFLANDGVANLMCLLLEIGTSTSPAVSSLSFNLLRVMLMHRHDDLSAVCAAITFRSYASVANFLGEVMSMNDEDVVSALLSNTRLSNTFSSHLESIGGKLNRKYTKQDPVPVDERLTELYAKHDAMVKNKYENIDLLLKVLQSENENLRLKIVHTEATRLSRFLQDQQDTIQYDIGIYNKMKHEAKKRMALHFDEDLPISAWILDSMEGIDRIRKKLLPYDDLEQDEKLKYSIDVPVKKGAEDDAEAANDQPRLESLSLNSFELIEGDVVDDALSTYNDRNRKVLKSLFPGDKISEIWNVSQVVGLEIYEGIMILGHTHIYIIQNYFHKADTDEIVEIEDAPEDKRDPSVMLITGQSKPRSAQKSTSTQHTVQSWELRKLTSVTKRRFLLRDVALELFFSNGLSFLITCIRIKDCGTIFAKLSTVATNSNIDSDLSSILKETNVTGGTFGSSNKNITTKLASVFGTEYLSTLDATKKWQNGEMSNFYYLMIINTLAGRTFNDLTQYPVFPWVIADYTSEELDLTNPATYRDLSKPMGAQTPQRAQQFKDRYEALQSLQDEDAPPFHYGTHYSSAMIVASFLIRLEPFVESYLLLQGGKFDHADRLFYSIEKAWRSSSKENTTDVRELIPEFFFLPEFLTNINGYDFGKLQDGTEVCHVDLPPWAKGDPKVFIAKNREALESPYVSEHLHEWIDLIFGYKQTGPRAVEAINVFNHLSYHGAIDLDTIDDEIERRSITGIIHNFGQTPLQLFQKPHPARNELEGLSLDLARLKKTPLLLYQTKFKEPIRYLQFKTHSDNTGDSFWRGYPNLYLSGDIEIKPDSHKGSVMINRKTFERLHDEEITILARVDDETFVTGSMSGVIHVWRYIVTVKGFDEMLDFEAQLRVHSFPMKELVVSPEFNILVSLDTNGECYLWDLARNGLIRKIGGDICHVAVAYDSGMIATCKGSTIKLFTINGEPLVTKEFESTQDITALSFGNSRTVSTIKINNVESHEYWKYEAIVLTGWSDGKLLLDELKVEDSGWVLSTQKEFEFIGTAKDKEVDNCEISVVEGYLKSFVNYEEVKKGKLELVAGDSTGRVAVWKL